MGKTFNDSTGKTWVVEVNVAAAKRVRTLTGVDLYALIDDGFKGFGDLTRDIIKLVDVLYVLCKPQADAANLTDEQFGERLQGDSLGDATEALAEGLIDFFPKREARDALRAARDKGKEYARATLSLAMKRLEKFDPTEAAEKDAEQLPRKSNDPSGSAPESSESTPDRSPSGN